jgi:hypothetical protein
MARSSLGYVAAQMDEREAFNNFVEALSIATAASRQMGFMRSEPEWFRISQQIATLRQMCTLLANRPFDPTVRDPALIGARK